MCLDVLGYAPLHGVHTHCPYSNTVVKYKDINHHKTSDTECAWRFQGMHPYIVYTLIVRAQKDLFFVLLLNCVLLPCYCRATLTATTDLFTYSFPSPPYHTACATCRRQPLYNRGKRPWERVQVAQTAV